MMRLWHWASFCRVDADLQVRWGYSFTLGAAPANCVTYKLNFMLKSVSVNKHHPRWPAILLPTTISNILLEMHGKHCSFPFAYIRITGPFKLWSNLIKVFSNQHVVVLSIIFSTLCILDMFILWHFTRYVANSISNCWITAWNIPKCHTTRMVHVHLFFYGNQFPWEISLITNLKWTLFSLRFL